jgi:hypothetical protein
MLWQNWGIVVFNYLQSPFCFTTALAAHLQKLLDLHRNITSSNSLAFGGRIWRLE